MTHPGPVARAVRRLGLAVGSGVLVVGLTACGAGGPAPSSGSTAMATEVSTQVDQQHVRAELRRRGGFVGIPRCATLDTAQLGPAAADRLRAAAARVDLEQLRSAGADPRLPTLDLTIVRGAEQVAAQVDERSLPAGARPLVALLDEVARPCT
jgi:hypothetical protein